MKFSLGKFTSDTLGGVLLSLALALAFLMVLIALYFFVYLPKVTNHLESITVPDIQGMKVSELEDFLEKKDLRYEVNDSSYSAEFPPLTVLKQYPHPGAKVKEGRKIFISVNRIDVPTVPLPNLVNGSVVNADAVLASNELKRGKITMVPGGFLNVVKEMKYRGAHIEPNVRVPKGAVIDLVVESGGNAVTVEDLVGQDYEDAKFVILGNNWNINVTVVGDTVGITPVVLKQKPEPGETIKIGDVVDIWIGAPGTEPPSE
ncbi:PASTA domain-containing protein [Ohtaekwangia sp.]|uniref:PASTA domain-containing protein n=1 Tax=Ohtaekwangia sp. TaxID=2066019 RepID=UPI002F92D93C